ncbi:MAG: M23 family metallopeptidase, partial [Muribaculum sp.]|nr:M23 family metallopeptidase [Muribaculum sp.]
GTGNYRIVRGFGKPQHPQLPKVTINNSGIDIEATKGATANAVFDGKVSAIFQQPGFNNIVMLRHGEYLTIYANLVNISVKNGDTVAAGQSIGTIYSDSADNDRTTLHFEIRHEKEKLDPTIWLKH